MTDLGFLHSRAISIGCQEKISSWLKARLVSQSASEINIAFLVDNPQIAGIVVHLHAILIGR